MRARRIELLQERQAIDKRIGDMQAELTKLDLAMGALPPLRTETHLELLIHTEAQPKPAEPSALATGCNKPAGIPPTTPA